MSLLQYRGVSYPVVVVSTSDFVIPRGETVFLGFAVDALRVWDSVYISPAGRMVNFAPPELVAQVFGNRIFVPTFNGTSVPQIIKRGEMVLQISPIRDHMGAIVYAFGNARM